MATIAYAYNKLGDQASAQQYKEVIRLNYPNLIKSNGDVNLRAARKDGSWVNRATLGIFGREASSESDKNTVKESTSAPERSWTNRLSLGLFDKPTAESEQ